MLNVLVIPVAIKSHKSRFVPLRVKRGQRRKRQLRDNGYRRGGRDLNQIL